ncbi:MAG: addiction module antidote protein [Pseudomonadota bacterium]
MKKRKLDVSKNLDTPERQKDFIGRAVATGDAEAIRDAVGVVARKRGMTDIATATNLNRESLYRSLGSSGNPEFATIMKVLKALGLRLSVVANAKARRPREKGA